MSTDYSCPVCERKGLPPNSESCPQCDADLTCFQALDTLSDKTKTPLEQAESAEPAPSAVQSSSSNSRFALLVLLLLLVVISLLFIFFSLKTRDRFQELDQRVTELNADVRTARRNSGVEKQEPEKTFSTSGMDVPFSQEMPEGDPVSTEKNRDKVAVYTVTVEPWPASAKPGIKNRTTEGREEDLYEQHGGNQQTDTAVSELPDNGRQEEPVSESKRSEESTTADSLSMISRESEPTKQVETEEPQVAKTAETAQKKSDNLPAAAPESLQAEKWLKKTFLYQTKKTDTLWGIAQHFYGDGKYYPVIMEQNPGLVISNVGNEETIRLLIDRSMLRNFYKSRIEWRDGLPLWKHKVGAGETWESIYARFSPPGSSDRVFYLENPPIVPGSAVKIILR